MPFSSEAGGEGSNAIHGVASELHPRLHECRREVHVVELMVCGFKVSLLMVCSSLLHLQLFPCQICLLPSNTIFFPQCQTPQQAKKVCISVLLCYEVKECRALFVPTLADLHACMLESLSKTVTGVRNCVLWSALSPFLLKIICY